MLNALFLILKQKPKKVFPIGSVLSDEDVIEIYEALGTIKKGRVKFEDYVWVIILSYLYLSA